MAIKTGTDWGAKWIFAVLVCSVYILPSSEFQHNNSGYSCQFKDHRNISGEFMATCCDVTDPQKILDSLPSWTTHLLLILGRSEDTSPTIDVSFGNLPSLVVVLLDISKGLAGLQLRLNSNALINNTNIRVLRSRVPLYFEVDAFLPLRNIKEVTLTGTQMDWDVVPELLNQSFSDKTNLTSLSLRHFSRYWSNCMNLSYFEPHKIFSALQHIAIRQLDLSGNGIHAIRPTFHKVFPKLEKIDISSNMLTKPTEKYGFKYDTTFLIWIDLCVFMPTMKHIDVSRQGKDITQDAIYSESDFTNTILEGDERHTEPGRGQITSVKMMNQCSKCLQYSYTNYRCACVSLNEVKSFSFGGIGNPETSKRWNIWKFTDVYVLNNSLSYVDLSNNSGFHTTNAGKLRVFGLDKLEYFNIQNNKIGLFNESFFRNFRSLKVLLLAGNDLHRSLTSTESKLHLKENQHLDVIDLSFNGLTHIPFNMFRNMSSLKHINISHNSLVSINISLSNMKSLEIINASFNELSIISNEMQAELDSLNQTLTGNKTFSLDISNNPFLCGCNSLQFLHWFKKRKELFINGKKYTCGHPSQGYVTMMDVNLEELSNLCYPSTTKTIVLSAGITATCIVTLMIIITIYCKRWRLRYWWYLTQKGWKQFINNTEPMDYDHDVFVAYNWKDSPWVHGSLLREMEEKCGLNLCIHQRDFLPGEVLEELIVEKIQKSRKTLLVLSPNFADSNWCHFELHMARNQLFEKGQDVLVLVILKPIPPSSVNGTLYHLLKKKLYLEWPEDAEGHELFWNKLAEALARNSRDCRPFD